MSQASRLSPSPIAVEVKLAARNRGQIFPLACVSRPAPRPTQTLSYPMGTGGPIPEGNARPGCDADRWPHLVPWPRMNRSYTSSLLCRLHSCSGTVVFYFFVFHGVFALEISEFYPTQTEDFGPTEPEPSNTYTTEAQLPFIPAGIKPDLLNITLTVVSLIHVSLKCMNDNNSWKNYVSEWSQIFSFFSLYRLSWLIFPLRRKNCSI
jgi:hypothetical protein